MTKDKKVLKIPEAVTTILQNHSGMNWPIRIPNTMAIRSFGTRPSLNFFFSIFISLLTYKCIDCRFCLVYPRINPEANSLSL